MSARTISARPLVSNICTLAEGPFWFQDQYWWVDIEPGLLHSVDKEGGASQAYEMGQRIGVAVPIDDRRFVVGLEKGVGIFDRGTSSVQIIATPEKDTPTNRFNDGKCDPAGRFIGGGLSMVGQKRASSLYSFDQHLAARRIFGPVSISNGLAWSLDGSIMYYIDSPAREVMAFPYDVKTGEIGEKATAIDLSGCQGIPDGMTIDRDGNLWIAFWGGWAVKCFSPATGEHLATVELPVSQPSSCAFGGPNLNQLFITTARVEISEDKLAAEPLAGSLFVCEPGVSGFPTQRFAYAG